MNDTEKKLSIDDIKIGTRVRYKYKTYAVKCFNRIKRTILIGNSWVNISDVYPEEKKFKYTAKFNKGTIEFDSVDEVTDFLGISKKCVQNNINGLSEYSRVNVSIRKEKIM